MPELQFSSPFSIHQLVKSLSFYISPSWKRYPFWADPPHIVHYRDHPLLPGLMWESWLYYSSYFLHNRNLKIFHFILFLLVLPPVLVPRPSGVYPKPPPPLPSPFRSAEEPPMPYNACFPFKRSQQPQPNRSPAMFVPGKVNFVWLIHLPLKPVFWEQQTRL